MHTDGVGEMVEFHQCNDHDNNNNNTSTHEHIISPTHEPISLGKCSTVQAECYYAIASSSHPSSDLSWEFFLPGWSIRESCIRDKCNQQVPQIVIIYDYFVLLAKLPSFLSIAHANRCASCSALWHLLTAVVWGLLLTYNNDRTGNCTVDCDWFLLLFIASCVRLALPHLRSLGVVLGLQTGFGCWMIAACPHSRYFMHTIQSSIWVFIDAPQSCHRH